LILGIIAGIIIVPAQAQTTSDFGYQLHPEKLLENTEGVLQIFVTSNNMMVPKQIQNLKVISSDNSIIEILGVEDNDDKFTKNILINAKKSGITGIVLAATGFSSKEISLEVFNNNNFPTQILMKITPESYPIDGPRYGHITLELATTGGFIYSALLIAVTVAANTIPVIPDFFALINMFFVNLSSLSSTPKISIIELSELITFRFCICFGTIISFDVTKI